MLKILRDEGILIFCLIVPLFYPMLYAFLYTQETVREVPVVVIDHSCTTLSREFLRGIDATPDLRIAAHAEALPVAHEAVNRGEAYGIVEIPRDFATRLERGEQVTINTWADLSGMLYYKAVLAACTNVSLEMNAHIKVARAAGTTRQEDKAARAAIHYEEVNLFNPAAGFSAFLIPAVLVLILQQTLLLGIGMLRGTRREEELAEDALQTSRPSGGFFRRLLEAVGALLKDSAPFLVLYVFIAAYDLLIIPYIFRIPQIGDVGSIALLMIPYLLACTFLAQAFSVFCRRRETAFLLVVFTSVPLLFLSGISWPRVAMPEMWQAVAALFPSTYGIRGFIALQTMGAELHVVAPEYLALSIQAAVYFVLALVVRMWSKKQPACSKK